MTRARESYEARTEIHRDWFQRVLLGRLKKSFDTKILVIGETGIGKSWWALRLCEVLDQKFRDDPVLAVETQICFRATDFLGAVKTLPHASAILYDEPGQSFFAREHLSAVNRILSKTILGYRFKRFMAFFTVPALSHIDKNARVLSKFKCDVIRRGYAEIYDVLPGRFQEQTFYKLRGTVTTKKPSTKLRHAYEKKKERVQEKLYGEFLDQLTEATREERTDTDMIREILDDPKPLMQQLYHNAPDIDLEKGSERLNVARIAGHFKVGRERARRIRSQAEIALDYGNEG